MGVNSRSKGKRGESKAGALLEKWTGKEFAGVPLSGGLNWTHSNSKGDVVCTTEGHYFPFCIEAKNYEFINFAELLIPGLQNITILSFWDQCQRDAKKAKKVPMLMMRYTMNDYKRKKVRKCPSDFFFIVIDHEFAKLLHDQLYANGPCRILRYTNSKNGRAIMIFDSNQFFRSSYKEVKRIAKTYLKTVYK